jgi:hypothetical protein
VTCPKNIPNMKVLFIMLIFRRKFVKFQPIRTQSDVRGKRFTIFTEITGTVQFTIRGGCLRYKRYDAHFLKKSSVELPFSSFGDHLINILRKVNRIIYAFKIN